MKSPYEELTKNAFDQLLRQILPTAMIEWNDVPLLFEPPDWFLKVADKRYAVEATTIVEYLTLTQSYSIPEPNLLESLSFFIRSLEKKAEERGSLSGEYTVLLAPIPNLTKHNEILQEKFLTYIQRTQGQPSASEETLGYVDEHRITIKKDGCDRNKIYVGIQHDVKSEGEIYDKHQELISKTLIHKAKKLHKISEPCILLLLDNYAYSSANYWRSAIMRCPERTRFVCISRIQPNGEAEIYWPRPSEWLSERE